MNSNLMAYALTLTVLMSATTANATNTCANVFLEKSTSSVNLPDGFLNGNKVINLKESVIPDAVAGEYQMVTDSMGNLKGFKVQPLDKRKKPVSYELNVTDLPQLQSQIKPTVKVVDNNKTLTLTSGNKKIEITEGQAGIKKIGTIRPLADGNLGVLINGYLLRFDKNLKEIPLQSTSSLSVLNLLSQQGTTMNAIDFVSFSKDGKSYAVLATSNGQGNGQGILIDLGQSKMVSAVDLTGTYGDITGVALVNGSSIVFLRSGMGEKNLYSWPVVSNN